VGDGVHRQLLAFFSHCADRGFFGRLRVPYKALLVHHVHIAVKDVVTPLEPEFLFHPYGDYMRGDVPVVDLNARYGKVFPLPPELFFPDSLFVTGEVEFLGKSSLDLVGDRVLQVAHREICLRYDLLRVVDLNPLVHRLPAHENRG